MIKLIPSLLLLFLFSMFIGCDELQTLPSNVPIVFPFLDESDNTNFYDTSTVCIENVKILADNQEKIKKIEFINAGYWTDSATPGLNGDLSFAVMTSDGTPIIGINLPNVSLEDYKTAPYRLKLSDNEIQFLESYLKKFINENECFTSIININNIKVDQGVQKQVKGKIEILVEAEIEF
jgi:hypothetical protein